MIEIVRDMRQLVFALGASAAVLFFLLWLSAESRPPSPICDCQEVEVAVNPERFCQLMGSPIGGRIAIMPDTPGGTDP
jgi:hypothetical protein